MVHNGNSRIKFGSLDEFVEMTSSNEREQAGGGGTPIGEPITYDEALSFLGLTPGGGDFSQFDFSFPPDDHFNQFGEFLYTDNKATSNIVIDYVMYGTSINNYFNIKAPILRSVELQDMNFDSGNFSTLANIATHYAKYAGININKLFNKSFSVGAFNDVYYEGGVANGKRQSYNGGKFWGQTEDG